MSRNALAYEWTRLLTLRSTWWIAAVAVAATAVVTWGYASVTVGVGDLGLAVGSAEAVVMVIGRSSFAPLAAGLIGVLAVGAEYRHRTLRTTALVTPDRTAALTAKAVTVACFAIAIGAAGLAASWAVGAATLAGRIDLAAPAGLLVGFHAAHLLQVAGWALIGLAVTVAARSQVIGLAVIVLVPNVVEPLFGSIGTLSGQDWLARVGAYLPFSAGQAMTDIAGSTPALLADGGARADPLLAGLVFAAVVAGLAAYAVADFRRQDL
ncbi:hypothetical protein LO763_19140 [Glycomyces sp. A-F 0318]|uniref:hypothetical protein n=1 Tax=Glycomyces amatae TaxID=2881355 RepID=UPI001E5F3BB5|nr:hypothetical protein [Glycomyces amatae]MCD0445727.1 hypothetical protein [Glycomyces amatae]